MIDVNKEAYELYPENWESIMEGKHDTNSYERQAFIAGHTSKATQAKVLQAQIDVLKSIDCNMVGYATTQIYLKIEELQQKLKQIENE
jgi:hypothetical protein